MGSVCCCLCDEYEDFADPNSSFYRTCICVRCFVQNFFNVYTSLFRRGEEHGISSSVQGTPSLSSTASFEDSTLDVYRSPPRPLPYDVDPRCFRSQRDGLVSRREKGSSHSHEETEPLRRSDIDEDSDTLSCGKKWHDSGCEEGSKEHYSKPSMKLSSAKSAAYTYIYSSSEDEDVCPTCLEEYTIENPKIITKCCHHFHLGCIYEWMERSDSCPVCGKVIYINGPINLFKNAFSGLNCLPQVLEIAVMVFDETT